MNLIIKSIRDTYHTSRNLMTAGVSFATFHHLTKPERVVRWLQVAGLDTHRAHLLAGVQRKLIGGVWLNQTGKLIERRVIKANSSTHDHRPIYHAYNPITVPSLTLPTQILMTGGMMLILTSIVFRQMQNQSAWRYYPEIRYPKFDIKIQLISAAAWAIYLYGFERLFRQSLLFGIYSQNESRCKKLASLDSLNLTTILYALVHLPNNRKEMLACVPMGYLFGGLALASGSFKPVYWLHLAIACTSDIAAAHANPQIST